MSRGRESLVGPVLMGMALGINLGNILHIIVDDSDERVAEVQAHNEQLQRQLIPTYKGLGHLVLDDEKDTFVFHIDSTEYPSQTCSGEYKVEDGHAVAVGSIACTEEHQIEGN